MSFDISVFSMPVYFLVFIRFIGMFAFNPFFARKNVPAGVRVILALFLTLIMAPLQAASTVAGITTTIDLLIAIFRELFIGFCCGFVFTVFFYVLFFMGDVMDMQMGISMAKVLDPGTNIQSSISSTFFTILVLLLFFTTDGHLVTIHLFASSFKLVPLGGGFNFVNIPGFMLDLFSSTFSLALRLVLPFIAAEFIVEVGMGILMKLIPQIHVFVINIQIKVILGIALMYLFAGPISGFLDNYIDQMLQEVQNALTVMGG